MTAPVGWVSDHQEIAPPANFHHFRDTTDGDISIDNINTTSNQNLFRDNTDGIYNTEMDGVTTTLTLKAPVNVGEENTIRIGIADAGDGIYDSSLMIVANSVQTALVAMDDAIGVTMKGEATIDLIANDTIEGRPGVKISHINDQAIAEGEQVTMGTGEVLRLNADGTVTVFATTSDQPVTFSYTITDDNGTSDTAFATITPDPVDGTQGNDHISGGFTDSEGNAVDMKDGMSEAIHGYGGHDKIYAGHGHDDIYGGDGNDFMRGQGGNDLIIGGAGNDVLDGGEGVDTMKGGAGNDIYYVSEAADQVIETGGGRDKVMSSINYVLGETLEDLWLNKGSGATSATGNAKDNMVVGNNIDNVVQGLDGRDALFGMKGNDTLEGGNGDDRLYAGDGNDMLLGGAGRDKLYGQSGSNTLDGGTGNDLISAGTGGDVIIGGKGNDILGGSSGADVFVFATLDGQDAIKHFQVGIDRIDFGMIDIDSVQMDIHSWGLTIDYGAGDSIIMRDIDPETVSGIFDIALI